MNSRRPENRKSQTEMPLSAFMRIADSYPDIEKVFYFPSKDILSRIPPGFNRIYSGSEFCENKILSPSSALKLSDKLHAAGISLSLVTPLVTERSLNKVISVIDKLRGMPGLEIIVNDFGILQALLGMKDIVLVAGRLLVRQKSDPRVSLIRSGSLKTMMRKTAAHNPYYASLLRKHRIKRVEMDNPLGGVLPPDGFDISIYYPYVFLSVSVMNCAAGCSGCDVEPRTLKSPEMPVEIILNGNTWFYENRKPPAREILVNRIIFQDGIPW